LGFCSPRFIFRGTNHPSLLRTYKSPRSQAFQILNPGQKSSEHRNPLMPLLWSSLQKTSVSWICSILVIYNGRFYTILCPYGRKQH
jgi:hypothetical protein